MIEREVFIAAPLETVFKFLTDAQLMAHWLGSFQQLDPQPGGVFQVEVSPGNIAIGSSSTADALTAGLVQKQG